MNESALVAVIDDEHGTRRALARLIATAGYKVCAFASAKEFLESPERERVTCVLSDLVMPNMDGFELQQRLADTQPQLSVVFITGHGDVPSAAKAMKGGAVDFLEKPFRRTALIEALNRAIQRTHGLAAAAAQISELRTRYERLTQREREVLGLVAAGLLNKQIGAELGAAEKTVKQHRGRVMTKMEAESLADLVLMAERLGVRSSANLASARGRRPSA
jgi:FixJ family two-component response regulator